MGVFLILKDKKKREKTLEFFFFHILSPNSGSLCVSLASFSNNSLSVSLSSNSMT